MPKRVAKREDTDPKEGEHKYGDVKFADEKNKKYPIDTEEHIRAAWNYINKEKNAAEYSAEDLKAIKARIVAAWKEKIDKDGPPSAEKDRAAGDDGTLANGMPVALRRAGVIEIDRSEVERREQLGRSLANAALPIGDLLSLAQRHLPNPAYNALVKADAGVPEVRKALEEFVRAAEPEDVSMAISSETPIDDGWGLEILDHSADGCDMSYAERGLPLRVTDSTYSHEPGEQVGILEHCAIGADRVLRGKARFSRSQRAQEIRRDVLDGIRPHLSVGGRRLGTMSTEKKDGTTVTRTKWQPVEATIVPVPADLEVGVGRSAREAADRSAERSQASAAAPKAEERTVSDDAAAQAAKNGGGTGTAVEIEGSEAAKIVRIAKQEGALDEVPAWLEKGMGYEEVCTLLVERRKTGGPVIQQPGVELTDKERKDYNIARGILAMADRSEGKKTSSFETELHEELEKKLPAGVKRHGGLLIPTVTSKETSLWLQRRQQFQRGEISRAGLDSATSTKGTELKFNVPGEFLVALRNKMIVMEAGAELMGGLVGPIVFPYQNGVGTATWVGENPGTDVADSNLLLTTYTLSPKTLQSSTSYSRQLLAQSSYDVDAMVRNDLALIMAIEIDRAALEGSGASNQPTGVFNVAGVDTTSQVGGTNGANPTLGNMIGLETVTANNNADVFPGLAYITTPGIRGRLKQTYPSGSTIGVPVWTAPGEQALGADSLQAGGSRTQGEVNGYPAWASQNVAHGLTKGTATTAAHVFFGPWSQLVVGDWGMFELIVDPYRLKKQGMIELTTFQMIGIVLKYPAGFAIMPDALP